MIKGTLFVLLLGTLAHFFYDWSGRNILVGLFAPVSESAWEHMKLVFFPMLLYALAAVPALKKEYPCIGSAFSAGILLGTLPIPVLFYTYTGILGRDLFPLDLATFVCSVLLAFCAVYRLTLSCKIQNGTLLRAIVGLFFIGFLLFSYYPPDIGLFAQP